MNFVSGLKFNATGRDFYVPGTIKYTLKGRAVANPDGSFSLSGSGHFTGGTGRFRGARGTFTFKGKIPKGSTVSTAITKGTIIY